MGELSEVRILVVVITFLSSFVILGSMIPYQFQVPVEGPVVDVPDYFEYQDLIIYNVSEAQSYTLNKSIQDFDCSFGGHSLRMSTGYSWDKDWLVIQHYFWFGPFPTNYHNMDWHDSVGTDITWVPATPRYMYARLRIEDLDDYDYGEQFQVRCGTAEDHTLYFTAVFGYNQTKYNSHYEAYDAEELGIWMGITWDQRATTMSAWDLVILLLTFQMPNIHWTINLLIAIPLWSCISYLIYVLIIKIIPFIAGG